MPGPFELRLFAAHAATTISNRVYQMVMRQYMVYRNDSTRSSTTRTESTSESIEMQLLLTKILQMKFSVTAKLLLVCFLLQILTNLRSRFDQTSKCTVSCVHPNLRDLHRSQPPMTMDSWKAIADIVDQADGAKDLSTLNLRFCGSLGSSEAHVLGKLFAAMRVGGPARLDDDGAVLAITNDTGIQITQDANSGVSPSPPRRRGSTLLLDSSAVHTHQLRSEIEKVQLLRARLPKSQMKNLLVIACTVAEQ